MNTIKMASTDRIFSLSLIDDKLPKNSIGMVDPRLFSGENKLHIKKDPETNFWSFSYERGIPPRELQCVFTSATAAIRHAELYYRTRNLSLKEIDA